MYHKTKLFKKILAPEEYGHGTVAPRLPVQTSIVPTGSLNWPMGSL